MNRIKIFRIRIVLTSVIVLQFCTSVFSQENSKQIDSTKSFIAVIKLTLPDSLKISNEEWCTKLLEKQYEALVKRNSEMLSGNAANTVWYLDTVISGSRFHAAVYSGITSKTIRERIKQNSIFLNSPKNTDEKRVINGILMYLWESDGGMIECFLDDELFDKKDSDK